MTEMLQIDYFYSNRYSSYRRERLLFLFSATKFAPNGSKTRALLSLVYA